MRVSNLQKRKCADSVRLSATVESPTLERPFKIWYEIPQNLDCVMEASDGNPFLAALLLPAMAVGEPLHIDGSVSPQLLHNIRTIQQIHHSWSPSLEIVPVTVLQSSAAPRNHGAKVGAFFSLGVDSFYTLLKTHDARTAADAAPHLVLIEGFDKRRADSFEYYHMLAKRARSAADELSMPLVMIRTNVRSLLERFVPWGAIGHGAAIASCGLAAGTAFRELFIAASFTYTTLEPWGSHPLLDRFWSTERTEFLHHGCEASRIDKLRVCADTAVAMQHLRVCYRSEPGCYNCGHCEKCIRTMMGLRAIGALHRCTTLPHQFDPSQFRVLHLWEVQAAGHMQEAIRSGESGATDEEAFNLLDTISNAIQSFEASAEETRQRERRWRRLVAEIRRVASGPGSVALIDEERYRPLLPTRLAVRPFPMSDDVWGGPPASDEAAIQELSRLRKAGVHHLVIARDSFWWLDHYAVFAEYLRSHFPVSHEDSDVLVIRLDLESGDIEPACDQPASAPVPLPEGVMR